MSELPIGTVTFLFTDIEGSTTRWERYPTVMKAALDQHDALLRAAMGAHQGIVFQTAGDSLIAAFPSAGRALHAALAGQRALRAAVWPPDLGTIQVRMALHTGPAELRDGAYHAEFTLNRQARLLAAGHGGQILCSDTTHQLLNGDTPAAVTWQDLGECWLKDLIRPIHIYQVLVADLPHDFAPLKTLDAPVPAAGGPAVDGAALENPYKGLRAFQEADAPDFFGREALAERLVARLGEGVPLARFLAVVGPSGSGKSSVVRAGVLPALRRGGLPGSEHWRIVDLTPGAAPLGELAAVLGATTGQEAPALLRQLQADEYGLLHLAQHLLTADPTAALVLVIDQFEEVFTLVADEAVRVHFLESLHRAVTAPDSPVRVILTLRADFYDRPLLYPDPGELLRQRTEVVLPLSPEELARAISSPAARVGVTVEPTLVGAMIQDVAEQPGTLPLLEYALTELFDRRQGSRMTLGAYRAGGGVQGAVGRRAEDIYAGLNEPAQAVVRQLFLRLVTPGDSTEDTRRRVRRAELAGLPMDAETLDGVLEQFSRYRLLTFDRDPGSREPTVEVAHEALIRGWERLRAWLDASRADLHLQRQLGAAAAEWTRSGREASYLARGGRLAQFAALATAGDVALTSEEQTYLATSQREGTRQAVAEQARQTQELTLQKRAASRLRVLLGGAVVFLVVALGLSLFAFDRQGVATASAATAVANGAEANAQRATAVANGAAASSAQVTAIANLARADAQRLAAEANVLLQAQGSNHLQVALLAIRSLHRQYTPQGDAMLGQATTLAYPQQQFIGHTGGINRVAFSPDGKQVLTSGDITVRLWDAATGQPLHTFSGPPEGVLGIAFAPDGKTILTGNFDGAARLWDVATSQELRQFRGHTSPRVGSVAFSPDGKQVLTGSMDKTARLWDAATGQPLQTFSGHTEGVPYVAFSPDGKQVLTGSGDSTARLWDAATGQPLQTFSGHTDQLRGIAFAPDGQTVLTGSFDGTARLWDAQTGQVLHTFRHAGGVRSVAFAPDGQTILTGGIDHVVRLWDVASERELRTYDGHTQQVNGVAFSPDGQSILTGGMEGIALLWRVTLPPAAAPLSGHTGLVWPVAFSPDGKYLLTGSDDTTARLWDAQTRAEVRQFAGHTGQPSVAFSPDGKSVLTSSGDQIARLWDTQTGAAVVTFTVAITEGIIDAVFTADGKGVLTTDLGNAFFRLWDAQTGQERGRFTGPGGNLVYGFSPDGQWALTDDGFDLRIWDMTTGREVRRFVGASNTIQSAIFSPDDKYVLGTSRDNTVRLWDAATSQLVREFVGHTGSVQSAAFSPDGRYVLTGSEDFTARLWEAQTGQELRRFAGHTDGVYGVAFAPNGRQIATTSADGTARLWDLDYQDTIRALCGRMVRDLTAAERALYNITDQEPTCPQP